MSEPESTYEQDFTEYSQEEIDANSPFRIKVRGTTLGDYLDTRNPRYMVALFSYGCAVALVITIGFFAFQSFSTGSILNKDNYSFFSKLFNILCFISGFATVGALFAGKYSKAFGLLVAFAIILTITSLRP